MISSVSECHICYRKIGKSEKRDPHPLLITVRSQAKHEKEALHEMGEEEIWSDDCPHSNKR